MRTLKAIALSYDAGQDRILAVVNPGALDSWAFWLTRRLVLALLGRVPSALENSSPLAKQVATEHRSELVAFEKAAAISTTAGAMSHTDNSTMRANAVAAELALRLAITDHGTGFRLELVGERGEQTVGVFARAELQRTLQMIEHEAAKGEWLLPRSNAPQSGEAAAGPLPPVRH